MTTAITVLLADDHPVYRRGLRQLIEQQSGLVVVGEADNGVAAVEFIATHAPDVAVVDLDMPGLDGFALAQRVRVLESPTRIVILTMHNDELHVSRALDLGIPGYLTKDGPASEVIDCIRAVASGRAYITPALSSSLLRRRRGPAGSRHASGIDALTPTERKVMSLLAELKTTRQIAADLGISPRTVDNHRAHICSKLDLQGAHALTKFALAHKRAFTDY